MAFLQMVFETCEPNGLIFQSILGLKPLAIEEYLQRSRESHSILFEQIVSKDLLFIRSLVEYEYVIILTTLSFYYFLENYFLFIQ